MKHTGISVLATALLVGSVVSGRAGAEELPACAAPPASQAKAAERFDKSGMWMVASLLEKKGEANFHLQYAAPASLCIADRFTVGAASVVAAYSPWQKGPSTLLYRLTVTRPEGETELLVIYDGIAALFGGGGLMFHLSEERQGVISWYAMYREEPSYATVKALAEKIVQGTAKPLMAVTWPKGAKEGELVSIDNTRLK